MIPYNTLFILAVFVILLVITKRKHENPLSFSLYLIFSVSFVCSIILEVYYEKDRLTTFESMLYLAVVLLLWIVPFNRIGLYSIKALSYNSKAISLLSNILSLVTLVAIIFFLYFSADVFLSGNMDTIRQDIAAGDDYARGGFLWSMFSRGSLLWTIISICTPFYHVCLLFYFVGLKDKWPALQTNLLFIGSLCFPVHILTSFGRDGIVFWCLNVFILYLMFSESLTKKAKASFRTKILFIASILMVIFSFMTYVRFGISNIYSNRFDGNWAFSLVDYMGQQPGNLSSAFDIDFRSSNSYFPSVRAVQTKVFGGEEIDDSEDLITLLNMGFLSDYNVFGYFVKSMIWKSGKILTVIISIIFCSVIFAIKSYYRKHYTKLSLLIILFTLYQIPMNGVFYLRQTVGSFDLAYVLIFISSGYLMLKKS